MMKWPEHGHGSRRGTVAPLDVRVPAVYRIGMPEGQGSTRDRSPVVTCVAVLASVACSLGCGGKIAGAGAGYDAGTLTVASGSDSGTQTGTVDDMEPCASAASCKDDAAVCLPANGSVHPVCCLPVGSPSSWEFCCSLVQAGSVCACLDDAGANNGTSCTDNVDCCSGTCSVNPVGLGGDGGTGICF